VIEMREVQICRRRAPAVRADGAVRGDHRETKRAPGGAVVAFKLGADRD
jgi:hypothetical protein